MSTVSHKQPKGFAIFFLTEMWERYGFYVIQTILVFYLLKKLHLNDDKSYVIVGSFTALAYINSFFGGAIADKFIGSVKATLFGGISLFLGYIVLGVMANMTGLTLGLGMISIGTGLLKPNVSSLLSVIYEHDDDRKDAGYTLYYVGIYVGALGGSLLGGYIARDIGWLATFFSSAVAILLGTGIFLYGTTKLGIVDKRKKHITFTNWISAFFSIIVMLIVSCLVLHSEFLATFYFIVIAIACLGFILFTIATHSGTERKKLTAFLFLILLAVAYWAIFFQQFFSLSLCADRACSLSIPASSIPSIESLGVILAGPLINYVWFYFKSKGRDVSIASKFSLSFLFNSICFLLISIGLWYSSLTHVYMSVWFIVFAYLIIAIGELCISPTSLAMVSSLVPKRFGSAMMGISLLSIGFGGKLAGLLASSAALDDTKGSSLFNIQQVYLHSFISYFVISIVTLIVSLIIGKYINKLIAA